MGVCKRLGAWGLLALTVGTSVIALAAATVHADEAQFALQVTPSPLISSVKPGEVKELELRVRNAGNVSERLKVELQAFRVDSKEQVQLLNEQPAEIASWITFSAPIFTIRPGEWFTERLKLNTPKDVGFSYSFAVVISRANQTTPKAGQQAIRGSVAVFALINVDRPGAKRQFMVESFASKKRLYEYLPADFTFSIKNTGNTNVQPVGNIFIQRSSTSQPIDVLKLNEKGSYILPGSSRSLSVSWMNGFPVYKQQQAAEGAHITSNLVWDWGNAQHFRFGHYVAKMVAVYNDGQRDVPVEAEVGFWVIPWKVLGVLALVLGILIVGFTAIVRKLVRLGRYARRNHYES